MPAVQVCALSDGWAAWVKAGACRPEGLIEANANSELCDQDPAAALIAQLKPKLTLSSHIR